MIVTQFLFSFSLFLSAFLLFIIQPMVAKSLLPVYGGTPAVWTVCMLFFQALLLVAYGYAWLVSRLPKQNYWRLFHGAVVFASLFFLPLNFSPTVSGGMPDVTILKDLFYQLSLPLLVVASSAPLLQFLYSRTQAKHASDPYFLYVASNLGSLLALLCYPGLIERLSGLSFQFYYWNYGFGVYLLFQALIFLTIPLVNKKEQVIKTSLRISMALRWIGYSFIPCSLMLGVTFYITTDIAATPLFWVIPLALYLLTFIITFAEKPLISHQWVSTNSIFFLIFPLIGFVVGPGLLPGWQLIIFHLANFFMLALLCHGSLIKMRPGASQLTSFYVCLALGGVLAGIFNGVIAPRFFNGAYEYPIVLALSILCIPLGTSRKVDFVPVTVFLVLLINYYLPDYSWYRWLGRVHFLEMLALILILGWSKNRVNLFISILVLFLFLFSPWFKSTFILKQQRNFYGIKQVVLKDGMHALISQSTLHGLQLLDKDNLTNGKVAYYGPMAGVVQTLQKAHPSLEVSILGLGTGLMACQFRKEDTLQLIDIDAQVISMAKDLQLFTYLRDCPPSVSVLEGDGRLVLQKNTNDSLDLLVVDAFSSDAIPTHLITKQALELYKQKLHQNGVLLLHTSNRHIQLLSVLTTMGQELDFIVLFKKDAGNIKAAQFPSEWVLMCTDKTLAKALMQQGWQFSSFQENAIIWTDDYSNLVPLLKWF